MYFMKTAFHTQYEFHIPYQIPSQDLTEEEYGDWYMKYREAELSIENRDEKIEEVVDEIENNLVLLGATGMHLLVLFS